jgi:hypothetical protein
MTDGEGKFKVLEVESLPTITCHLPLDTMR